MEWERDLDKLRLGEPLSESDAVPLGDLARFQKFFPFEDLEAKNKESSSIVEIVVAAVVVEFER